MKKTEMIKRSKLADRLIRQFKKLLKNSRGVKSIEKNLKDIKKYNKKK